MKILNNGPSGVGQFLTLNLLKNDFTRVVVTKKRVKHWVVATQIFFMFILTWGFMIQFDEHIFQMGWFNHQLETCGT